MRMLAGVLAAQPFTATLIGDASLSRPADAPGHRAARRGWARASTRPTAAGRRCAVTRRPRLTASTYTPEVPSAQVKSAVLLAGLQAEGSRAVVEPAATRDHTERALTAFGVTVGRRDAGPRSRCSGGQRLQRRRSSCGCPATSSAAAFWVAAAALAGSAIDLDDVGLNPTRTALFDVLRRARRATSPPPKPA